MRADCAQPVLLHTINARKTEPDAMGWVNRFIIPPLASLLTSGYACAIDVSIGTSLITGNAIAAKPGYPTVIVPFGMIPNSPTPPFPEGFKARPVPYGVAFTGTACSEPRLIELAYAFERATKRRVPPPSAP